MDNNIVVNCKNIDRKVELPAGFTLSEIKDRLGVTMDSVIVAAKVNNKVESLHLKVNEPSLIEFMDITQESGMRCYVRSLCLVLSKAVADLYPKLRVNIKHSLSKGYFFSIDSFNGDPQPDLDKIKHRMSEIIDSNMDLNPLEDDVNVVADLFFERKGFQDTGLLLQTSDSLYAKYYKIDNYIDFYYGVLVPSTACLQLFDIVPLHHGYLLRIPDKDNPEELAPIVEQPKMYRAFREHGELLKILNLENVGEMNRANNEGHVSDIIKVSEALQEKKIAEFASTIKQRYDEGVRIVLIAGPSSSGKTTFRKRLEIQLMTNLIKPVGLSLDDYFVNREKTPLDENGDYDFESLYALDLDLFNKDLNALLRGERVEIPTFNFTTGKREYNGHYLQIDDHSVLLIEGIHGLNPLLTSQIEDSRKFLIYISALTTISLDRHNWIPTSDNRLLRRLVRDYKYRSYSAIDTLSRWTSVRSGEDKWIFPYQENADVMFNSAMIYELAALKKYAEPILLQVSMRYPEYAEAKRLLKFLSYFTNIDDKELPPTSLIREFIGGSSFRY